VIIEPSGVGKLSDVMKAVRDVAASADVTLGSAVTVVDASKCRMYMKNFGEFFNNQIEHAGTIVLSRTDVVDEGKVQKAVEMLREHNQSASIVTTPCSQLTGQQLLEIIEKPDTMAEDLMREVQEHHGSHHHHDHGEECGCEDHDHSYHHHDHGEECGGEDHDHSYHHHDHGEECGCEDHDHSHHHHDHGEECGCGCHDHNHHHADEVFSSWGMENVKACDKETLETILDELANGNAYGDVLRAKGMVPSQNPQEWFYFDIVPDEVEIRMGKPDYTGKVCVIGAKLKEEELKKAFGRS